jgi:hypothetical protein
MPSTPAALALVSRSCFPPGWLCRVRRLPEPARVLLLLPVRQDHEGRQAKVHAHRRLDDRERCLSHLHDEGRVLSACAVQGDGLQEGRMRTSLALCSNACSSKNRPSGDAPSQGATERTAPKGYVVVITVSSRAGKRCDHLAPGAESRPSAISTAVGKRPSTRDSARPMPTSGRRDSRYAHSGPSTVRRVRADSTAAQSLG